MLYIQMKAVTLSEYEALYVVKKNIRLFAVDIKKQIAYKVYDIFPISKLLVLIDLKDFSSELILTLIKISDTNS